MYKHPMVLIGFVKDTLSVGDEMFNPDGVSVGKITKIQVKYRDVSSVSNIDGVCIHIKKENKDSLRYLDEWGILTKKA